MAATLMLTDEQLKSLSINRDSFHGEWSYTLSPRTHNDSFG